MIKFDYKTFLNILYLRIKQISLIKSDGRGSH
jgi:hypothetical protein